MKKYFLLFYSLVCVFAVSAKQELVHLPDLVKPEVKYMVDLSVLTNVSPLKGGEVAIQSRLQELQRHLTENESESYLYRFEQMKKNASDNMRKGSSTQVDARYYNFSPNRKALLIVHPMKHGDPIRIWNILKDNVLYEFDESNMTIDVLPISNFIGSRLSTMSKLIDGFGLIPAHLVEKMLNNQELELEGKQWKFPYKKAYYSVQFNDLPLGLLKGYQRRLPDVNQAEEVRFENFDTLQNIKLPLSIYRSVDGKQLFSESLYQIKNLKLDPSYEEVPILGRDFGLVSVIDHRFEKNSSEKITYMANLRLPDDEKVVEWLTNPMALEKHNMEIQTFGN